MENRIELDVWSILDVLDAQADATLLPTASAAERAACRFAHAMAHLSIGVNADEQIAGSFGWEFVDDERQAAYLAEHQRQSNYTPPPKSAAQTAQELLWHGFHCGGGYTTGHTCADYQRIIERGLCDVVAQIDDRLTSANPTEQSVLESMRRAVEAMVRRGVPSGQAHRFSVNSCMGLVMPGAEISDMWGGVGWST